VNCPSLIVAMAQFGPTGDKASAHPQVECHPAEIHPGGAYNLPICLVSTECWALWSVRGRLSEVVQACPHRIAGTLCHWTRAA
jgi:hypothetical protein